MANPSLPCPPTVRARRGGAPLPHPEGGGGPGVGAAGAPGPRVPQPLCSQPRPGTGLAQPPGRAEPRAGGARGARRRRHPLHLLAFSSLLTPGAARLRPRLQRPGGLAPRRGAHAKQINMPGLTHASQPADRVSAAPCGN